MTAASRIASRRRALAINTGMEFVSVSAVSAEESDDGDGIHAHTHHTTVVQSEFPIPQRLDDSLAVLK